MRNKLFPAKEDWLKCWYENLIYGTSLAGSIPGRGTKIAHAVQRSHKKKKKKRKKEKKRKSYLWCTTSLEIYTVILFVTELRACYACFTIGSKIEVLSHFYWPRDITCISIGSDLFWVGYFQKSRTGTVSHSFEGK